MKIQPVTETSAISAIAPTSLKPEQDTKLPQGTQQTGSETLSTTNLEKLRSTIQSEPEIRGEQVQKALTWLSDPNYPPLNVLNAVASIFVSDAILKQGM